MEQLYYNLDKSKQEPQLNEGLAAEFEALKAKPIERAEEWTIVNFRLIVGCGCGGGGTDIHIAVPGNHPGLEDRLHRVFGNRIHKDDVKDIQSEYPGALVMKGHAEGGVTDSYRPSDYYGI